MRKLMLVVLLTVVPSALRAATTADKLDLGAARESASVDFDRLIAKDAGTSVVLPNIGPMSENGAPFVLTESKKKTLMGDVPAPVLADDKASKPGVKIGAADILLAVPAGLVIAGMFAGAYLAAGSMGKQILRIGLEVGKTPGRPIVAGAVAGAALLVGAVIIGAPLTGLALGAAALFGGSAVSGFSFVRRMIS